MGGTQNSSNARTHRLALALRRAAEKRGYSTTEVAKQMGVTTSQVNSWYRGQSGIRRHDLQERAITATKVWEAEAADMAMKADTGFAVLGRRKDNGQLVVEPLVAKPVKVAEPEAYQSGYRQGYRDGFRDGSQG